MRKNTILFILLCICVTAKSQTVILERDVEPVDSTKNETLGADKNKLNIYLQLGVPVAGGDAGAEIKTFGSILYASGILYNYRMANVFSAGLSLGFNSSSYSLKQNAEKLLPDTILHDKEYFNFYSLDGGAYLRFTYDEGKPGKYIDVGANAYWVFGRSHTTIDNNTDNSSTENITHKPPYIEKFQSYATVRLGFNSLAIGSSYRISNYFNNDKYPELPRLNIFLQINPGG